MEWIKKNRDWLITLLVFSLFGLVLLLVSLFRDSNDQDKQQPPTVEEEAVFELSPQQDNSSANGAEEAGSYQSTSFFLRPAPGELLAKLEGLNHQEFRKESKKLPGLRIMWPAYFFAINKMENEKAEVFFDASEDGFGVMLVTEIDTVQYPQILTLQQGQKIWLAAEITGIDPTGTGQFLLKTEYVRFDDYEPPVRPEKQETTSQ